MPSGTLHGGAEQALLDFAYLHRSHSTWNIEIVFLEEGELVKRFESLDIPVHIVSSGRLRNGLQLFTSINQLRKLIRRTNPDLILSWMTKAHIYAGTSGKWEGVPCAYFQMGLPDNGVVDRLSRLVPAIGAIGCSDFVAREQGKKVRHRVIGVPLAFDSKRFLPAQALAPRVLKKRFGFDPDRPLVGIVGRLQRWKGMHVFAAAMRQVLEKRPDVQGVIVGGKFHLEPDYEGALKKQLKAYGIENRVRMVGAQSNVPEWIQSMDIFVHASEREPFGIVIIEAMSLGKPVIATRPGGPEEIIDPGVNGELVDWNDSDALAHAIESYLAAPRLSNTVGINAARRALDFTPEFYTSRLSKALEKIIKSDSCGH